VRQVHPGIGGGRKQGFGWLKSLALLPLPLFIVLIIFLAYTNPNTVIEPPYLLTVLNILFLALIPFTIAYLAWRSYAVSGQMRFFFIGCGMVAFGLGASMAGIAINVIAGLNASVTIFNSGALLAAILFVTAAISSLINAPRHKLASHRALRIGLCYLAVFLFMSFFCVASYENLVPTFFVQGAGPTVIRQFVLGIATALFAISSVIFLIVYSRSRADFTYWFSIALAIIALGLIVVFFQKVVGSPIGWVGRAAQYMGCVYLIIGVVAAYRVSNIKQIPLENEFARSFNYIEANYKTLVEMAPNAVISCDKDSRILSWNPAAAKIFGYTEPEAIGADVIGFIFQRESASLINSELQELARVKGQSAEFSKKLETMARRKKGEDFPVEVYMAVKKVSGEWLGTFIISDITESKRMENELQKLASVVHFSSEMVNLAKLDGKMIFLNQAGAKMLGIDPQKVDQFNIMQVIPDHLKEKVQSELLPALMKGGTWEGDLQYLNLKTGLFTDVHAITFTVQDPATGSPAYLANVSLDITERKQAEEALRKSEKLFQALIEHSSDIVTIVDALGTVKYQSPNYKTLWGRDPSGEIGRDLFKDVHPDDVASVSDRFNYLLLNPEGKIHIEVRARHEDGSWLTIDVIGHNLLDNPAVRGIVVHFHDITVRKRADEAILRSKLLLQSVIDSTPDLMYVKDFQHRFLLVNKSFAEAQNIAPQDMIGRADTDFFAEELCLGNPDKGIRGFHADDNQAFQGKTVHNPGNIITWADGSLHIYDTYKIPLADQPGKIYAALVYSRDITEQRKAEDEREASFKTLHKTLHDVINTMAKIVEMRDPYTSGHQARVAGLAGAIAIEMKLDDSRVEHLMMAASIHDVGKMYVPADILSKPGKLSEIEWAMIKTHVEGSYEILKDLEFSQPIALMALQHHERLDGSGYPGGLKGEEMVIEAKILAVADVVEAMSSHRPYRPALGLDKALEEISSKKGVLYDLDVVDTCLKLFNEQGFKFE